MGYSSQHHLLGTCIYISLYTTWHLAHNGSEDGLLQEIERKNTYCIETQNTHMTFQKA